MSSLGKAGLLEQDYGRMTIDLVINSREFQGYRNGFGLYIFADPLRFSETGKRAKCLGRFSRLSGYFAVRESQGAIEEIFATPARERNSLGHAVRLSLVQKYAFARTFQNLVPREGS